MNIKEKKARVEKEIKELKLLKKDPLKLSYLKQELRWIEDLEKDSNYTNYIETKRENENEE